MMSTASGITLFSELFTPLRHIRSIREFNENDLKTVKEIFSQSQTLAMVAISA